MRAFRHFITPIAFGLSALFVAPIGLSSASAQSANQSNGSTPASLVADSISINAKQEMVATGNVEVFYQDAHLKAKKITYQSDGETLLIKGPLTITRGSDTLLLADSAELDPDFERGLLIGARVVMGQQLQIAANRIQRVNGRYTQLYKSVASSCEVCANNPTPLWEIRAESILHDQLEKQLYFDNAQLRVMGYPLLYLPNLRLPDPTLDRSRGFLIPGVISDSNLGIGVRVPYFLPFGDSKDLTLAPLITQNTNTVEFRYRQMFNSGQIEFDGAISRDNLRPGETRGYLLGEGKFKLNRDFVLSFNAEAVSDHDYLLTYDFSDRDLLNSFVDLTRAKRNEYISTTFSKAQSLRDADDNTTLPNLAFDADYERRYSPDLIGGTATFSGSFHSHARESDEDIVGRDLQRGSIFLNWKRTEQIGGGVLLSAGADLGADYYAIQEDSTYPDTQYRSTGTLGAELRWPLMRRGESGAKHLFVPIVQAFHSPLKSDQPPNEDSQESTLDEGNLFSISRFAGSDRREAGTWANIGFAYKYVNPKGLTFGTTVGRVLRAEDPDLFNIGSGLEGTQSDWLASFEVDLPGNLSLASHSLIDDDFSFTRSETLLRYRDNRFKIETGYLWLTPEPAIDRFETTSEWTLETDYIINDTWSGDLSWRYDIARNAASEAGIGLTYQNECVEIDVSLSRRFTSSDNVDPSTSVGMTIELTGFGATGSKPKKSVNKCLRYN